MAYVRCSEKTHERLKLEAVKRRTSMQALVEQMVDDYLNNEVVRTVQKAPLPIPEQHQREVTLLRFILENGTPQDSEGYGVI